MLIFSHESVHYAFCTDCLEYKEPTWEIRILILLGEAHKWNTIEYPRIFNDIPFIGSRIFHNQA